LAKKTLTVTTRLNHLSGLLGEYIQERLYGTEHKYMALVERTPDFRMTAKYRSPELNRLEENIKAVDLHLMPDDLREIESASSKIKVEGARYPERADEQSLRPCSCKTKKP
jgi:hypothetical protein